jgi:hypothetical protein
MRKKQQNRQVAAQHEASAPDISIEAIEAAHRAQMDAIDEAIATENERLDSLDKALGLKNGESGGEDDAK